MRVCEANFAGVKIFNSVKVRAIEAKKLLKQLLLAWCVVCPVEEVGFIFKDDALG